MDKALYSHNNTEWETPQDFFDICNRVFKFDLDVCATAKNTKCVRFFTPQADGLTQEWRGTVWCNPPYGRSVEKWVSRARDSRMVNDATVVMLLPARTDTKWFHQYVLGSAHLIFLKGRLKFVGADGSAPFPSALAIYGTGKPDEDRVRVLAKYLDGYAVLRGGNA